MADRPIIRLHHIKESIDNIRRLLHQKNVGDVRAEAVTRAALERFLEVISEASRHIPLRWKQEFGSDIIWSDIAALGNVLRHAYDNIDVGILWAAYRNDLDPLERAIDAMLAAHDK